MKIHNSLDWLYLNSTDDLPAIIQTLTSCKGQ